MNRHTWHLPNRSFAAFLAEAGFDVFIMELRGVGLSRRFGSRPARHPDHYIQHDLPAALRAVRAQSGQNQAFLIGHSLGGLISYCAMPDIQKHVRGLVTLSGVFSSLRNSQLIHWLSRLARPLVGPLGPWAATPLPVQLVGGLFERVLPLVDSRSARRIMPVHAWYPGTIERPILKHHARIGWDRSSLGTVLAFPRIHKHGELFSQSGQPYLERFTTVDRPLLVIAAECDTLLAPDDARTAFTASRAQDKSYAIFGPTHGHSPHGHLDMIIGHKAQHEIWPEIRTWLHERSGSFSNNPQSE